MYPLIILPPAARFLKKLKEKPLKAAFQQAIDVIRADPYRGELKTGDLSGVFGYDLYYNKTNYDLAYTIIEEGEATVVVILAGTRENLYEELKGYMKNTSHIS
jgi:mRNA interferase RelE/StbE